jgi:hypothetical protein
MSGRPHFNHPEFHRVARLLREEGLEVINPAELDSVKMQTLAGESLDGDPVPLVEACGETWADVLARDVKVIGDKVSDILLLHDWQTSRGARLEAFVGCLCGVNIWIQQPTDTRVLIERVTLVRGLVGSIGQ